MKKILFIAISSQIGGVPKHIWNIIKQNKDYQISIAVPSDGDYFFRFHEEAFDVIDLQMKPYSIISLYQLAKYIKKNHIDLVHSHGKGAGMYARPLKLLCPWIKVVHTFHGIYLEQYSVFVKKLYLIIERSIHYLTDKFVCVSNSEEKEAQWLKIIDFSKTVVIPNGVDLKKFEDLPSKRNEYLAQLGLPENAFIIGCVARLDIMKGHKYLIEAFEKIHEHQKDCYLLLVGDGPYRPEIEKMVESKNLKENIILLGFRHDIPLLLSLFDIFVSCSLKEGMPYTLIEALASKTPVVATDVIGNHDIIRDGYNGFLAESKNSDSVYLKLMEAIENPTLCHSFSQNGLKDVKNKFTVEQSVQKLLDIYYELIG